jgi:hypothetical protein
MPMMDPPSPMMQQPQGAQPAASGGMDTNSLIRLMILQSLMGGKGGIGTQSMGEFLQGKSPEDIDELARLQTQGGANTAEQELIAARMGQRFSPQSSQGMHPFGAALTQLGNALGTAGDVYGDYKGGQRLKELTGKEAKALARARLLAAQRGADGSSRKSLVQELEADGYAVDDKPEAAMDMYLEEDDPAEVAYGLRRGRGGRYG